jgi:hypothetical protein
MIQLPFLTASRIKAIAVSVAATLAGSVIATFAAVIPVNVLDLSELVARADLVVVGTVTQLNDSGRSFIDLNGVRIEARQMDGTILVDRVVKGLLDTRVLRLKFIEPQTFVGYRSVGLASYRLIVLRRDGDRYTFASPYYPSFPAVPGIVRGQTSPLDDVVATIAAVIGSPGATRDQKREAIWALSDIRRPSRTLALRSALDDQDPTIRYAAMAGLIAGNDLTTLPAVELALSGSGPGLPSEALHNFRVAIGSGVVDEAAVPALGRLLRSSDVETRRAAARGLGNIKAEAAIKALAPALDDQDFEVRLQAVRSLASITNQDSWMTSDEGFRADEARFMKFWKAHVRQH